LRDADVADRVVIGRRRRALRDCDIADSIVIRRRRRALCDPEVSTIVIGAMMSYDAQYERQNKHH
jgi:hypothetical protein